MNIPECYEAFRQAEQRAAAMDKLESRRKHCGCCGRVIELGEHFFTVLWHRETFPLCRSCKDDVDESETIMEEEYPYGL